MNYDLKPEELLELKFRTLEYKVEQLQQKSEETVIATVQGGKIKGAKRRSIYNDVYYSFERIPYAQPPVGELRFRAPKPASNWKNVLDCTHYATKPMQMSFVQTGAEGTEDCLYLNVFTNDVNPSKPRSVMVWIYGGGFEYGEATREWYSPDYFMKEDVILVTVQYRLGALGFLSLQTPGLHIPGNAGLKDQIMALKWVKRNCASFGGNPDNITVFGESAGGGATHLLMLTDQAKGLFHRAIAQSGVAIGDWGTLDCGKRVFALAEAAGYQGANNEPEILKFLLSCTAKEIVEAQMICLSAEDMANNEVMAFGPCIEPYITPHTVMHKPPMEMLKHAWGNSIPMITGVTSNEGLYFLPLAEQMPDLFQMAMEDCISFLPAATIVNRDSPETKDKGLKLRKLHVTAETPTADNFFEILSFAYFLHPMHKTINARLQYARKAPTYLYRFDFDSDKLESPYRLIRWGRGVSGVAHADELSYLFCNVLSQRMEPNSREFHTIERMIGLWTAFAKSGDPNVGRRVNGMKGIKWSPLSQRDANALKCLNISDKLEFIELPEMAKLNAWQELYNIHRDMPKTTEQVDLGVYVKSSL